VPLKKYAIFVCKDITLAQDIFQEALFRAWKWREKLQNTAARESWLKVIIRREFIRYVSTGYYQKSESIEYELLDVENMDVSKNSEFMQVLEYVANLPEIYRIPFQLSINGMCNKDIANRLNTNKNTVVTRIFRARKMVKLQFSEMVMKIND
jgi:RNA polymerase sigma-70 factor (ECF subfamily)